LSKVFRFIIFQKRLSAKKSRFSSPSHAKKPDKHLTIKNKQGGKKRMDRYVCTICGYIYDPAIGDPDNGVAAGTKFEAVPDTWECPICGAAKDDFEKE
jgi:rubredoxin